MNNPIKKLVKLYFNFAKKDRNAIIVLSVLILLSIITNFIFNRTSPKSKYNYAEYAELFEEWEKKEEENSRGNKVLFDFNPNAITEESIDSLQIPENIKRNIIRYRKAGGFFSNPDQLKKIYGMNDSIYEVVKKHIKIPKMVAAEIKIENSVANIDSGFFDPNIADKTKLTRFGFSNYQLNNVLNYRKNGGSFYRKEDLLKIYGIDSLFYLSVEKHIKIETLITEKALKDTPVYSLELNSADTTSLIRLRGIGPVYANRIIKYRDLLGGFYSKAQLLEVYNFPPDTFLELEDFISTDTMLIKKIRINFAEFAELLKHPYLNKEQVQEILKYRESNGSFIYLSQIQLVPSIDALTYNRIQHYITCR